MRSQQDRLELAVIISVLLHLLLIGLFLLGSLFTNVIKPAASGSGGDSESIEAVMVDTGQVAAEYGKLKQQKSTPEPKEQPQEVEDKPTPSEIAEQQAREKAIQLAQQKKQEEQRQAQEKLKQEQLKKQQQEEATRKKAAEAARLSAEAEAKRLEAAAKQAEEERKAKAEAQKKLEQKQKAEQEAKAKQESEAKAKQEQAAKEKAEQEAKLKAENAAKEAKEKAEQAAKEKAEKEAKEKAEKAAKEKAEKEAKAKAEKAAKEKAEKEAKAKAEKEAKAKADAARAQQLLDGDFGGSSQGSNQNKAGSQGAGNAKSVGDGFGTEDRGYENLIKKKISRSYITDDSFKGRECLVKIFIERDGRISNHQVLSGPQDVCRAATSAIIRAKTVPPAPSDQLYAKYKSPVFTFSLKVQ